MRILFLSFYYPPDLSAGSFRASSLIEAFSKIKTPDLEIDIITTQPNRYSELSTKTEAVVDEGWLRVQRISLPPHKSGMKDQARSYTSYAREVLRHTKGKKWDLVFATSSRLMTAALGAYISKKQKIPLYLDIRDLFHDTMGDVLGNSQARHVLPAVKKIEKWTFQSATSINVVSKGFVDDLNMIVPKLEPTTFSNGIDPLFLDTDFKKHERDKISLPTLLYAGNIGEGQGLHRIIPQVANQIGDKIHFKIIGGGGRAAQLKSALTKLNVSEEVVEFAPPVQRLELIEEYREADMLFLHLNDYDAFRKVLPSKIFEYAATGKPIIAGVAGYSAEFLKSEVPHAMVFDPCDVQGMIEAVMNGLNSPVHIARKTFCAKYNRSSIMENMASDILSAANR